MKARLPEGYGGGSGGNMNNMLRQAQKMQEEMEHVQAELEARTYEVSSGGGAVTAVINGKKELLELHLKPEIVDPDDVEMLEDLLKAAFNEAIRKVEDTASDEMGKVTGGLKMPGLV